MSQIPPSKDNTPGESTWSWIVDSPVSESKRADISVLHAIEKNLGKWTGEPRSLTRSGLQNLIGLGRLTVNSKAIKASTKLNPGDRVQVTFPPPIPTRLIPEERNLDILFEDAHIVVLNKPPGLTVHPSPTQMEGTLVHALLHSIKDLSGINGQLRPGIVHRIDKNTSGAIVVTKTDEAHVRLAEDFSKHLIDRTYWALCYGSPNPSKQKIESLIGRHPTDRKKMSMTPHSGRKAITHIQKLEEYSQTKQKPFASLVAATLETGRTHQVRVHLTGIGHPLLGDPVYGTPSPQSPRWKNLPGEIQIAVQNLPGQALHARLLGFKHPITSEYLRFEADPPPEFSHLLQTLKQFS